MTRLQEAIGLGLILGVIHGLVQSAGADYATGWQYSVSGTNVSNNGASLLPPTVTNSVNVTPLGGIEGQVTSSATGLDFSNSNFTITNPGEAFQFTQTYMGPGMTNQTVIQRTTEVTSVTDTTSIFTQ